LLTLSYIWFAEWRFRFKENVSFRFWTMLWVLIALVCAALSAGYFAQKQDLLPSGNPQYRMLTYEAAWQKFVSSPIWGTGFTAQATEKFRPTRSIWHKAISQRIATLWILPHKAASSPCAYGFGVIYVLPASVCAMHSAGPGHETT
jgi:O-antigen ligase